MLKRLFVDGYKCYSDFEMKFEGGAFSFLAGRNGSGKTTLFEVMMLLRDISALGKPLVDETSGRYAVMGDTNTRWRDNLREQRFEMDVCLNGGMYHYTLVVDLPDKTKSPRIQSEIVQHDNKPIYSFVKGDVRLYNNKYEAKTSFHVDWSRSFLSSIATRAENSRLMRFREWLSQIVCIRPNPTLMNSVAQSEVRRPDIQLSNFASWLRFLKQSADDELYSQYLDDVKSCIPGLSGIKFNDVGDGAKELCVTLKRRNVIRDFRFSELSDGQKMLMAMYAVVYFAIKEAAVVCIDEPDNYLALSEITPLISSMQDAVEDGKGAQFMVASHHPEFYRQLAMDEGFLMRRAENGSTSVAKISDVLAAKNIKLPIADVFARGWED